LKVNFGIKSNPARRIQKGGKVLSFPHSRTEERSEAVGAESFNCCGGLKNFSVLTITKNVQDLKLEKVLNCGDGCVKNAILIAVKSVTDPITVYSIYTYTYLMLSLVSKIRGKRFFS